MSYTDIYVVPVREKDLAEYKKLAETSREIWKDLGALEYVEYIADDAPEGKVTDFHRAVKREDGEVIVVAYAVYKSKDHRDELLQKAMADPRMPQDPSKLPFEGKRLFWGGFKPLI